MSISPARSRRQPHAPSPVFLPDELIAEILSWLSVKPLMRLRCVSKSWNTLISDPTFVKMHLKRSARNPHLTLMWKHCSRRTVEEDFSVVPFPVCRLLENPSTTVPDDPYFRLKDKDCNRVVGSCNGLLCLLGYSSIDTTEYLDNWLCFWNPATRILSEKLGSLRESHSSPFTYFKFAFGYDNSSGTYKVVAFRFDDGEAPWRSEVRVFTLGDNSWRSIQGLPVVPLHYSHMKGNDGVYFSDTLNWLALCNNSCGYYRKDDITIEQFVIVSLDLSTETYRQLLLPPGFDEVPLFEPAVGVLKDCLCFSHDFKGTEFVIWQLKDFGVQDSWTQFLRVSYQNLQMDIMDTADPDDLEYNFQLLPLFLTENGDTLILASAVEGEAILYNWRDNRVERTGINKENGICWFFAKEYVESLVSTS